MTRRTLLTGATLAAGLRAAGRTRVEIRGEEFWINGKPTYAGREWQGIRLQGRLMNSRMVQGIFDDENPATVGRWAYPDTKKWDAERNNREFLRAMPEWRRHGLLGFTICFQGGSPEGYSKEQPWHNSAYRADGTLKPAYLARMARILDRADELGMVAIVGFFYFGQDERLENDAAVRRAVVESTKWLHARGYRNILIEIANECDNRAYQQPLIKPARIAELFEVCRAASPAGRAYPVSASFNGGSIPHPSVVKAADYLLIHGNGVKDPRRITQMVTQTRNVDGYRPMPVVFNEDDHFDFDQPENNMLAALRAGASWGYFDPGKNDYQDGYQSPPVQWGLNTERKKQFFAKVKEMTGA